MIAPIYFKKGVKHKKNQIRERWRLLTERGILDTALLPQLWGEFDRSQWGFLIALMSKFGLLCHLWEDNQYLVPSLLPEMPIAKIRTKIATSSCNSREMRPRTTPSISNAMRMLGIVSCTSARRMIIVSYRPPK